ncbi:hypothetical protein BJX70DRAFT_356041 [Aspergillus crustosus]
MLCVPLPFVDPRPPPPLIISSSNTTNLWNSEHQAFSSRELSETLTMCHKISWYHALCLHPARTSTVNVCCKDALECNYDCAILESWSLPIMGACSSCQFKATFAREPPRKSRYGFSPIMESFEDEILVGNNESWLSGTHSENSIDELELFDMVTF